MISVLDDDNSGDIDYRELITGLEIFRDTSFEEKLKSESSLASFYLLVFFDLCDVDKSGTITKKELYDVLKRSMAYEEEKAKLKRTSTSFNT